jgi:hypothetical protein
MTTRDYQAGRGSVDEPAPGLRLAAFEAGLEVDVSLWRLIGVLLVVLQASPVELVRRPLPITGGCIAATLSLSAVEQREQHHETWKPHMMHRCCLPPW